MKNEIKQNMLKYEKTYSKYATYDQEAIHLKPFEEDIRPSYFRDIDRIIHSLSYTRYLDKTQVFSFSDNDHISKRIVHVTLVSKIARTIGRALNLNEDLIEAIALGHDLGHVPFGHVGEAILNELSLKYTNTYFNHNVQSVRLLMNLENSGLGSNLTLQTLDGILCHNGESCFKEYAPVIKTKEQFLKQYEDCYIDPMAIKKLIPMTLEGCVVRLSDIVGYVGRDIEDAVRLGILKKEQIPKEITDILGSDNRTIVNTILLDVIDHSTNQSCIKMSDKVYQVLVSLKKFNYEYIYNKANTKEQIEEYKKMFSLLFEVYLKQLKMNDLDSDIYQIFLKNMSSDYINKNSNERKVIDFISGMTDDYFIKEYHKYVENK